MAYLPFDDEDEEQQGQPQGSEKVLGGESSIVNAGPTGGSGSAPASSSNKATNSGTGWTNLRQYVTANEGADQRMGQAVKGEYSKTADANQAKADTYGTTADETVKSNTVTDNGTVAALQGIQPKEMKLPEAGKAPGRGPQPATTTPKTTTRGGGVQNQAAPAPAPEPIDYSQWVDSFATQTGGYKGPNQVTDVDGFYDAEKGVQSTQQANEQAQDFEGRRGFLRDAYVDPRYSSGEQRLDSFITGAGAGGRASLDEVSQSAGNQKKGWEDLINRLGGDIDAARTTSEKTKADTLAAYTDASGRLGSAFDEASKNVEAHNTSNSKAYKDAMDAVASGDPKKVAWGFQKAGVDPDTGQWLLSQGIPADQIIKQAGGMGLGDIAGDENIAAWDFLSGLGETSGTPAKDYDFTRTGGGGGAYDIDADLIGSGGSARQMESAFNEKLASAQTARDQEADDIRAALQGTLGTDPKVTAKAYADVEKAYGVNLQNAMDIAQGVGMVIDPAKYIKSGVKLTHGDVLGDDEKKGWSELTNKLGIKGLSTKDTQDEGAAWTFDKKAFEADLAKVMAERNRQNNITYAKQSATAASRQAQSDAERRAQEQALLKSMQSQLRK